MISREWYLFFQGVFNRVGGADGVGTSELEASLFEDAGSSETNAMLFALEQDTGQVPPMQQGTPDSVLDQTPARYLDAVDILTTELSELQARMAELVKEIDALKQSVLL
jgi:hypothetical protein